MISAFLLNGRSFGEPWAMAILGLALCAFLLWDAFRS